MGILHKDGFFYVFSEVLKMEIGYKPGADFAMTEDFVRYSIAEINRMAKKDVSISLQVHLIKKEFKGEIVFCEKK